MKKEMIKIYIPKTDEIREKILEKVEGTEEKDSFFNKNNFHFWKELSKEEFDSLSIHSKEHTPGNVLIFENNETWILDGLGYCKIQFVSLKPSTRVYICEKCGKPYPSFKLYYSHMIGKHNIKFEIVSIDEGEEFKELKDVKK